MKVERTLVLAERKVISSSNQQLLLARWLVPLLDRGSPYSFVDLGLPLLEAQKLSIWYRANRGSHLLLKCCLMWWGLFGVDKIWDPPSPSY